ncbi:MAG: hypothetical protein ACUVX8_03295 [Candidatus Zipacnadales bacterium]
MAVLSSTEPAISNRPLRAAGAVVAAGLAASAAQVVIIRELLVASAGNELCIAAVLAAWLFWSALGSWVGGRVISRSARPAPWQVRVIAVLELFILLASLLAARAGLWALRAIAHGALVEWGVVPPAGGTLSLPQLLLLTTLASAPIGLLLGWQFAAGANLLGSVAGPTRGVARAYVFDSLGHLVGGAILAVPAVITLASDLTLVVAGLIVIIGAVALDPGRLRLLVVLGLGGGVLMGALALRPPSLRARWWPHRLAASYESPYGNISVLLGEGEERSFFLNGNFGFETSEVLAGEQWVDIPLLAHPNPQRILLIGGGPRTLRQVLRHNPQLVVYCELDPTVLTAIRQHAPAKLASVLEDPRVALQLGDARHHLRELGQLSQRLGSPRQPPFDVLLIGLGDPTTAQLNRYYTREWLQSALHLTGQGVVAFQAMSSSDYLGKDLRAYNACLYQTAQAAGYEQVHVFPGPQATFLCSGPGGQALIFDDPPALERRIAERGLEVGSVLGSFYDALDPWRRADREREMREMKGVRINRDFAPTCYYYAQVLWAGWWRGRVAEGLRVAGRLRTGSLLAGVGVMALLVVGGGLVSRRPWRLAALSAVFAAGTGGMTLEVVILLGLQSVYGYVYGMVGLLIGLMMAGLAAGAWLAQRRSEGRSAPRALLGLLLLLFLETTVVLLHHSTGLQQLFTVPFRGHFLALSCLLMAAIGGAVGGVFPLATAVYSVGGPSLPHGTFLYGVDLVGAATGALLAGLILIPLLGTTGTCTIVLALMAGAAATILIAYLRG